MPSSLPADYDERERVLGEIQVSMSVFNDGPPQTQFLVCELFYGGNPAGSALLRRYQGWWDSYEDLNEQMGWSAMDTYGHVCKLLLLLFHVRTQRKN